MKDILSYDATLIDRMTHKKSIAVEIVFFFAESELNRTKTREKIEINIQNGTFAYRKKLENDRK